MSKENIPTPAPQSARDALRSAILGTSTTRKRVPYKFLGQDIELVQPTVQDILDTSENAKEGKESLVTMLIRYAYVPGTDEKVFEEGDIPALKTLPFDESLGGLALTLARFNDLQVSIAEKN